MKPTGNIDHYSKCIYKKANNLLNSLTGSMIVDDEDDDE